MVTKKEKICSIFVGAALFLAGCTENHIKEAHQLMERGDFLAARKLYSLAAEQNPQSLTAHYGLGMSWCAEAIYKTELGLAESADWYYALYYTTLASKLGDSEEVRKTLAILHFNLAAHYRKKGDNEAAIPRLEQALSYDNTLLKALNLLGAIYHESGDLENAELSYHRIIALEPEYAVAHFNLGAAAWARGDFTYAQEYFQRAVDIDSNNRQFKTWLKRASGKNRSSR